MGDDKKVLPGTKMHVSAAELATSLKGHVFVIRMIPTQQHVHAKVTGDVTADGKMEVMVVASGTG